MLKKSVEVVLNDLELRTLRRVLNALGSVPFVKTKKPDFEPGPLEKRLRSVANVDRSLVRLDLDDIELALKAIDAVCAEYTDDQALHLYLGSQRADVMRVKGKLEAHIHAPV